MKMNNYKYVAKYVTGINLNDVKLNGTFAELIAPVEEVHDTYLEMQKINKLLAAENKKKKAVYKDFMW